MITDNHALWEYFVDDHGLKHYRSDAVSSCKRKRSAEAESLEWSPENGLPSLKRRRPAILKLDSFSSCKRKRSAEAESLECPPETGLHSSKQSHPAILAISPQLLSKPTPVGDHVDEAECVTDADSDKSPLDGSTPEVAESPQLKIADTCLADDSLFSEFLRSLSPSCITVGEFSGCSSDTAVNPLINEALSASTTEPLSEGLDHDVTRADGQSNTIGKPIRIRLRIRPPQKPSHGIKIVLRLKGPKLSKGAKKRKEKAGSNEQVKL